MLLVFAFLRLVNISAVLHQLSHLRPGFALLSGATLLVVAAFSASAQLPDGPGRTELEKMCKQCHELARSISLRQDRDGWNNTLTKMTAFGMKANDRDL